MPRLLHKSAFLIEGNPATVTSEILLEEIAYFHNTMNLMLYLLLQFWNSPLSPKLSWLHFNEHMLVSCTWIFWNVKLHVILPITKVANKILLHHQDLLKEIAMHQDMASKYGEEIKVIEHQVKDSRAKAEDARSVPLTQVSETAVV